MPPIVPNQGLRQAQTLFANSANQVRVLAQQPSAAVVFVNQADADWEFSPFDIGKVVEGTSSSPQTFTVPASADVPFPVGAVIEVFQAGAGQITIAAAGGVTVITPLTMATATQYATIGLRQRSIDVWVLNGELG